jgi:hypothetical protein
VKDQLKHLNHLLYFVQNTQNQYWKWNCNSYYFNCIFSLKLLFINSRLNKLFAGIMRQTIERIDRTRGKAGCALRNLLFNKEYVMRRE